MKEKQWDIFISRLNHLLAMHFIWEVLINYSYLASWNVIGRKYFSNISDNSIKFLSNGVKKKLRCLSIPPLIIFQGCINLLCFPFSRNLKFQFSCWHLICNFKQENIRILKSCYIFVSYLINGILSLTNTIFFSLKIFEIFVLAPCLQFII